MTGTWLATRSSSIKPRATKAPRTSAPATPPAMAPARVRGLKWSDLNHLEIFRGAGDRAGIQVVEDEARLGMAFLERRRGLPAHVAEDVARTGRLDDRDVGPVDQPLQRRGGLGVARVRKNLAAEVDPVAVAAGRAVVQRDGLIAITAGLAARPGVYVAGLEARSHDRLPVDSPAHLEQRLEAITNAGRSDDRQHSRVGDA